MQYAIIIEKGKRNYSAYVPDLPGCVATGSTVEEVTRLLQEGIALHLADMRATGQKIPESTTKVFVLDTTTIVAKPLDFVTMSAAAMGSKGGAVRSGAKSAAARANGAKGGRPRKAV